MRHSSSSTPDLGSRRRLWAGIAVALPIALVLWVILGFALVKLVLAAVGWSW